jgi:hypothetical protein
MYIIILYTNIMGKLKTITVTPSDLKKPEDTTVLATFRVEAELFERFKEFCDKELDQPHSKVLRAFTRKACKQHGY